MVAQEDPVLRIRAQRAAEQGISPDDLPPVPAKVLRPPPLPPPQIHPKDMPHHKPKPQKTDKPVRKRKHHSA